MFAQELQKKPRTSRNDEKWESLKSEIHQIYILEGNTLPRTMQLIYEKHKFSASPRKWKMVLKDWKFEKHLTELEMKIIVAKAEKRSRENGRQTVFLHHGTEISSERLQNFKRRKAVKQSEAASPSAATPPGIIYHTPRSEDHYSPFINQMDEIPEQLENLQILDPLIEPTDVSEPPCPALDYLQVQGLNLSRPTSNSGRTKSITDRGDIIIQEVVEHSDAQPRLYPYSYLSASNITIDTANEAERSGDFWNEHGKDSSAAIEAYKNAISQFSHLESVDSLPVCRILTKLASIQTLKQAIPTYRKAIEGYTKRTGENSFYTTQNTEKLAEILFKEGKHLESERLYWKATRGYLEIGHSVPRLRCLLAIAEIYRRNSLYEAELEALHGTLAENLKMLFDIYHAREQEEVAIILVTLPLKRAYSRLNRHGIWDTIVAKLVYMGKHLYNLSNPNSFNECLHDTMNLAELYSQLFEFTTAESIFRIAINRLQQPADQTENKIKATIFLLYSRHLDRQGDFAACQSALSTVSRILQVMIRSCNDTRVSSDFRESASSIERALSSGNEMNTATALRELTGLVSQAIQLLSSQT